MRLRLQSILAGPGGTSHPGDELVLPDEHGRALVARGYAVEIVVAPQHGRREEYAAPLRPAESAGRKGRK